MAVLALQSTFGAVVDLVKALCRAATHDAALRLLTTAISENRALLPRYDNSTRSTSSIGALHLGDYVAAGLDLTTRSDKVVVSTSSVYSSAVSTQGYEHSSNNTTPEDQCWNSWARYWSLSTDPPTIRTTYASVYTYTDSPSLVAYTTFEVETTVTTGMGNFPTKTYVTTVQKESAIYTELPFSSVQGRTVTALVSPSITLPPCSLPTYVSQCQSSWSSFIAAGSVEYNVPLCAQASITGELCQTFRSNWLERQSMIVSGKAGMQWDPEISNGTTIWPSNTTRYIWPTTSPLAPGCTVGCMSCRVSGSRVKVLHWPPQTSSWRNGTFVVASTTNAANPVTTVTEGMTLTSPTVYISFDQLSASNSCKVIGTALSNVIVAITNSATLSSLYGWDRYYGRQQTASFNFTDLYVTPVPDDIYMSQPRCASSSVLIGYSCLPMGDRVPVCASIQKSGFNCPRTLPYEPVLAMPAEVRHLQPEWIDCIGGLFGVYDPPLALHEAASVLVPTAPAGVAFTSAQATPEPDITTSTPASPSPQVSSPPAPTQVAPDTEPSSIAISEGPDGGSDRLPPLSAPVSAPAGNDGADPTSLLSSNGDGPEPPQIEHSGADTGPEGNSAVNPSPTDALGVLTQALSHLPGDVAASPSPVPSQAPQSLPVVVIPDTTGTVQSTLTNGNSGLGVNQGGAVISSTASFQYDPAPSVLLTFNGQPGAVVQSGPAVILHEPTRLTTLRQGQTITQGSQTLVLNTAGLILGTTTIPIAAVPTTPAPGVVLTAEGDTYTVQKDSNGAVVAGDGMQTTLVSGGTVSLDGHTIALGDNGHITIDGTTRTVPSTTAAALDIASEVVLPLQSTTLTIVEGAHTTFDGTVYSAPSGGGAVIVHGNSTTSTMPAALSTAQSIPSVVTTVPTDLSASRSSSTESQPAASSSGASASSPLSTCYRALLGMLIVLATRA